MSKPLWQTLLELAVKDEKELKISCQECYNLLDQYAEMLMAGVHPSEIMDLVKEHLSHCPGCDELLESLLTMLDEDEVAASSAP